MSGAVGPHQRYKLHWCSRDAYERLLVASGFDRHSCSIAARRDFRPPIRSEGCIHGSFDTIRHQRVSRTDLLPRVGLVLTEVRSAVVIRLNMLREGGARGEEHQRPCGGYFRYKYYLSFSVPGWHP